MSTNEQVAPAAITIDKLSHAFSGKTVLDNISLTVPKGTILALLGPSGCGKSTLLKLLAGLLRPDAGTIHFGDQQVAGHQLSLPPEQRHLGMVFQDYALWPHMTVAQNVAFPLLMRKVPRDIRRQRVDITLKRVGLAEFADRKPADLSGGQQQRVALARAIIAEPHILLFDEPLSNLDRDLRESLCQEMASLLRHLGTTAVYVTHDRGEAKILAHRTVHMSQGHITDITTH
ncbi:ABC transporter ATP-binding protein [Pectobacterium cacticida]|uniref:ABC transporter ATP-binding protein n=1 Tax=Pectobacterium cacticida TaxID=69221 RepID=UPI003986AA8B